MHKNGWWQLITHVCGDDWRALSLQGALTGLLPSHALPAAARAAAGQFASRGRRNVCRANVGFGHILGVFFSRFLFCTTIVQILKRIFPLFREEARVPFRLFFDELQNARYSSFLQMPEKSDNILMNMINAPRQAPR